MPDSGNRSRPDVETFGYAGCRVSVVDPAGILAAARTERVDLLRGGDFPAPVQRVRLGVRTGVHDGRPVYQFDAMIVTPTVARAWDWPTRSVLGSDPIGVLLARRVAAGDPWAVRIVDGVGTVAAEAYRRLGLTRPASADPPEETGAEPVEVADPATGLRAVVSDLGTSTGGGLRSTGVRAVVGIDDVSPSHVGAMFRLVLGLVAELTGADDGSEPLAGRTYVLSRQPERRAAPAEEIDAVTLDQVGGLPDVVTQFRQIAVSFEHPDVMARWGARRPQGILMYGPPGTGKTMLARALANEIGARFREIRTPEILDKWLGGSERNIKRIFRDARRYREPTVMLFDEFDSIISYAGAGGDAASQAVNAVAGIFKQEMNTLVQENPNVIVVATTNFPERVDDSLIRSGRFDVKISEPLPDETGRAEIFSKMIGQLIERHDGPAFRMFADDVDPAELGRASAGMTGADVKEILRRVQLAKAMQEARTGVAAAPISQSDLEQCITELRRGGSAA